MDAYKIDLQLINQSHLCGIRNKGFALVRIMEECGLIPTCPALSLHALAGSDPCIIQGPGPLTTLWVSRGEAPEDIKSLSPQEPFTVTLSPPLLGSHFGGGRPPASAAPLLSVLLQVAESSLAWQLDLEGKSIPSPAQWERVPSTPTCRGP